MMSGSCSAMTNPRAAAGGPGRRRDTTRWSLGATGEAKNTVVPQSPLTRFGFEMRIAWGARPLKFETRLSGRQPNSGMSTRSRENGATGARFGGRERTTQGTESGATIDTAGEVVDGAPALSRSPGA
jgi:hypothetical protein